MAALLVLETPLLKNEAFLQLVDPPLHLLALACFVDRKHFRRFRS